MVFMKLVLDFLLVEDGNGFGDVCRYLHAIFYAMLMEGNVRGAMELVELVVREPDTSKAIALFARNGAAKTFALAQIPKVNFYFKNKLCQIF